MFPPANSALERLFITHDIIRAQISVCQSELANLKKRNLCEKLNCFSGLIRYSRSWTLAKFVMWKFSHRPLQKW